MLQGVPLFRLYRNSAWHPWHKLQQFYFFAITALFGLKVVLLDLGQLLTGQWSGVAISKLAMEYWPLSVALKVLFYVRFIALPLWLSAQPLVTAAHLFWTALVRTYHFVFHQHLYFI
jgi:hypothetical protein